ncbi:hypothetical protein MIDIC_380001 [Alphaproteobacteria bacterium]
MTNSSNFVDYGTLDSDGFGVENVSFISWPVLVSYQLSPHK